MRAAQSCPHCAFKELAARMDRINQSVEKREKVTGVVSFGK